MRQNTSARIAEIARSGEHLKYADRMAKPVPEAKREKAEADMERFLAETPAMHLSTSGAAGWSATYRMPFVARREEERAPVLYVRAAPASPVLAQIDADPRVSCSLYLALGFEQRRQAYSLNLQGLACALADASEIAVADRSFDAKYGASPEKAESLTIRILGLQALWYDASTRLRGTIDYAAHAAEVS